jgi:nucleoside-diphosphate-sugar epimerase
MVLITGAAGFIGSHLTERYLRDGETVVGLDNLATGDLRNLTAVMQSSRFRFVEVDVTEKWHTLRGIFAEVGNPDLILHFASPASPVDYAALPLETMAVNSRGTELCLEAAGRYGARFLFASTSEAYGDPLEHPQREGYWGNVNSVGPRSCYDEAKRFGEALVMAYMRTQNIDARIIRIFNTYGPRMRPNDGRVVPNFIAQALAGKALTVYGDGTQTRSFCYVDDLVEGIVRCAVSEETRGLVVNLGNPEEHPIERFARIVCDTAGVTLRVESRPLPVDDPTRRCPDISRARELLGWEPSVALEDGLRRTVEYVRGQPAWSGAST